MKDALKKLLAKVATLTNEELDKLQADILEGADFEDTSDANLKALAEIVEAKKTITAERAVREEAGAEAQAKLDALKAELAEPEPEPEVEDDKPAEDAEKEDEPSKDTEVKVTTDVEIEEPEAIAASLPKPGDIRKRVPAKKQTASVETLGFTASVSGGKVRDGDNLSQEDLGSLFAEKINGGFRGPSASEQRLNIARLDWGHMYPEDRILDGGMRDAQIRKLQAEGMSSTPEALTASGGLCAPVTPYYQLADISQAGRPVRDSLIQFNASRGGITFNPPSTILDFGGTGPLGQHTVTEDEAGGSKACLEALCNAAETEEIYAVWQCLEFGNMRARTFPEQVAEHVAKTESAHSRFAERLLIGKIDSASATVTSNQLLGSVRDYFATLDRAVAAYRNRHRMAAGATLQVLVPLWLKDMFRADLVRQLPGDDTYAVADAMIASFFAARNVAPTYSFESLAGSGQDFGAQGNGVLLGWPSTVIWYLYHPGMFLFLDGGTLDLGIVRDSTLNSTNDYQIFSETFEGLAAVGLESLKITSDVCPDGKSSAAEDITACFGS